MLRTSQKIRLTNSDGFKQKLLLWAQQFKNVVWLDSNNHKANITFDAILAVDSYTKIKTSDKNAFEKLKKYQLETHDFIFGYLSYDLKNNLEKLNSTNFDGLHFPELYFFQPKKIFIIKQNSLEVKYLKHLSDEITHDIHEISSQKEKENTVTNCNIKPRIKKQAYFKKFDALLEHIQKGNLYEVNFCQEFYSENTHINPVSTYLNLNKISKPPFASFLKFDNHYLLSASPERYLKKNGATVISQPIKGTEKRAVLKTEDELLRKNLEQNPKEISENIMIVDLVRNDFSRFAEKGSVKVDELCKAYRFKQVHQLISTISCNVNVHTHPVDIIKHTFPMGSMTGAPKISAMKIIESIEETKRGLYSGAVGYFTPNNDFDFNVVIRSILYNANNKYISYTVGSAITSKSVAEKEYNECLLKAEAMKKVLLNTK